MSILVFEFGQVENKTSINVYFDTSSRNNCGDLLAAWLLSSTQKTYENVSKTGTMKK